MAMTTQRPEYKARAIWRITIHPDESPGGMDGRVRGVRNDHRGNPPARVHPPGQRATV